MAFFGITDTLLDNFGTGGGGQQPFTWSIYTNEYLNAETEDEILNATAVTFDSLYAFDYKQENKIAYETLEESRFSSDSLQASPYYINAVGVVAPVYSKDVTTYDDFSYTITNIIDNINTYMNNTALLTIIQRKPLFETYSNLHLVSWAYKLNPTRTILYAEMKFQQVRMTEPAYTSSAPQNVSDPENGAQVDSGSIVPEVPTLTNSTSYFLE